MATAEITEDSASTDDDRAGSDDEPARQEPGSQTQQIACNVDQAGNGSIKGRASSQDAARSSASSGAQLKMSGSSSSSRAGLQNARGRQRPSSQAKVETGVGIGEAEPLRGLKFSFLCLSGVDDSVSPRTLCDISQEFSFVEWGVNFRADKQGKEPRYASLAWLRQLREEIDRRQQTGKFAPIHFAAHLGGEYCVDVMKGDASLVRTLWEDYGFLRVQLSPTRVHGVNSSQLRKYLASLKSVISALPQVEFVLEVTKETRGLSFALMDDPQPNLAFFFNCEGQEPSPSPSSSSRSHAPENGPSLASSENGVSEKAARELRSSGPGGKEGDANSSGSRAPTPPRRPPPCPHPGIHVGYGGCLTADNLRDELRRIAAAVDDPRRPVWIDLEAGLRSQGPGRHDEFDLGKVWACIRIIFDLGLPRPRPSYAAAR
ncbi:unnamed protein product [Polarella glacialis]|uniref:Uncharacterized protein n=1 Tax=Polarella glacialis TaxID=89957 RepID=A0A813JX67_POLGL|nr:unnamed protein product [Polarella glacialis]CAE8691625.1 unnamed protein product [Polarella glacialis]